MKRKIVIGTIALCIVGGTITLGAAKSGVKDDTYVEAYSEDVYFDDQDDVVKVTNANIADKTPTSNEIITREEAIRIAEKEVSGKVYSFEMDEDDGRFQYELELQTAHGEVEIEMDAKKGQIIETDYDYDRYDD